MSDHLAALFFTPVEGSAGRYVPGRFDLHPRADGDLRTRLVHHHEAQHAILTATTAWGVALLVAAEMAGWQRLFGKLLDLCRVTHESFATYLSCSTLAAGFGSPDAALAAYPDYVALVDRLRKLLVPVSGGHRRALAATALARACMQTPVVTTIIAAWPQPIALAALRRMDLPDERFEHLVSAGPESVKSMVTVADAAVVERFGPAGIEADQDDAVLDDRYDDSWELWEETMFSQFAGVLRDSGATVLAGNGHLEGATELVQLALDAVPTSRLDVHVTQEAAERRTYGLVLNHARLWLARLPRPARLITVGVDAGCDDVIDVVDATARLAGRPNLVLSARLPARLLSGYDYPDTESTDLAGMPEPVVGVRSVADDGHDGDAVWFARLPDPDVMDELARTWDDRGDLSCCVATSCLLHDEWRRRWLSRLHEIGPLVFLIDVGVSSLVDEFGGRVVHGVYLDLGSSPVGALRGALFKVTGTAGVWLAVSDDVGIELLVQEVAAIPLIDLRMTGADWTRALPTVRLVVLDLLHTESYFDLRGLTTEGRP